MFNMSKPSQPTLLDQTDWLQLLLLLLLTMYWFKWRCRANDAGALYRVIKKTVWKVVKKLAKTEPKQMCFSCCRKEVKDETVRTAVLIHLPSEPSSNPGLTSSTGRSGSDRRHLNNLVGELHNCSNRESVHCLDVYTRSLFMSIVHRPSETVTF